MSIIEGKLRRLSDDMVAFMCPGCETLHQINTDATHRPAWQYNGNPEAPTFKPSILVRTGHYSKFHKPGDGCWCTYDDKHPDDPSGFACGICHSFVTDGRIQFLGDCTHELAGQTVDLPDIEAE